MKQSEILKVLQEALGVKSLAEVNRALKSKEYSMKFRLTGPAFVHFGFTGLIKALTPEGVKIYNVNKVNLIHFEDIETFKKAVPREVRKGLPKSNKGSVDNKKKSKPHAKPETIKLSSKNESINDMENEDDEDYDDDDDFDPYLDEDDDLIEDQSVQMKIEAVKKKKPKKSELHVPGSGSRFIPKKK